MTINSLTYNIFIYPFEKIRLSRHRKGLLRPVEGSVLEIGAGTGINLKHYNFKQIKSFTLTDLNLSKDLIEYNFPKHIQKTLVAADVENLPFEDHQFDYIVFTLVFCSVPNPEAGLKEIARVLKPNGKIIFIEHVLPKNPHISKLFNKLTPFWKQISSGCHLNRETLSTIESCGFHINKRRYFFRGTFVAGFATLEQ